jgi:hypothetical protein
MDVFLYFYERLPFGLDEVEDALDQALGDSGEVTGTGVGEKGSNVDIRINDESMSTSQVVRLIHQALSHLQLPDFSRILIEDKKFPIR